MTLQITLPSELEERLRQEAERRGQGEETVALRVLDQHLPAALEEVQIRCRYRRQGNRILDYTVQLEIRYQDCWQPVVRYDNAHGFCHFDTIHADGTQDKTPVYRGDANVGRLPS